MVKKNLVLIFVVTTFLDLNANSNVEQQKSTMLMNNDHHHQHRRSRLNVPDSHSSSGSSSSENDHPWETYSLSDQASSVQTSPVANSQWSCREQQPAFAHCTDSYSYSNYTGLLASIVREEGYVYSLAAIEDTLYTGSDSKNIRVWKNRKEFAGFKSTSGLVKSIVIADDKIFTGHRDGKIRVWNASVKNPSVYKKIGTLPNLSSIVKKAIKPKNYTEVWRNHRAIWIKHFDVISSLGLTEDHSLLYSGSWDKTIKVWRVSSFKCLESIPAHDDAVNAVVAGFDDLVFSGSADGAVKVWRREVPGKRTKHLLVRTLLNQDCAVTSLVVDPSGSVVYAGLSDGLLHYWERDKLLLSGSKVLRCHNSAVLCLAVAGSLVISGSADTNICVWRRDDLGEHKCACVLRGHSAPVKCLAVERSRRDGVGEPSWTVYSGSLDRSVKIWRVCTQMDEEEPRVSKKDRSRRSDNVGFETFTDQGRLNEGKR